MRVAFTGKGGSGKTTMASLFAMQMAKKGKNVLALDADINQHLAAALGFTGQLRSMGEEFAMIKKYLHGDNLLFDENSMHKTTPPGRGSQFISLQDDDWFMKRYVVESQGVRLAGAGEIPHGNVGVRCYHGLNGAVELILGHMLDGKDDVVIVDMTAGADAFSSSLFAKVDALVLVVEPTLKSLSVYDQFLPKAKEYKVPFLVVGNKVQDEDDKKFIESKVGPLIACVGQSAFVRKRERGLNIAFDELEADLAAQLDTIYSAVDKIGRDWDLLEERSHLLHRKNADDWMGKAAHGHIDDSFTLREYARVHGK